jgi:hypothetical protein
MGALRLYSTRSTIGAKGGILSGLMKVGAKGAMRSIPGVGLATTAFSASKALLPKKPGFGTGLVTGMASGPATKAATAATRTLTQKAVQTFTTRKKYRRQNVGNMKALRRAIRRIQGAEKLFRQVLSVQGKSHTGIKPKKKGR